MSYQAKPIDLLIPLNEFPEGINAINSFDESWKEYHSFDGGLNYIIILQMKDLKVF